jgi:hypothetical protein
MEDAMKLLPLDHAVASREMIELLIEDPSEVEIFEEIARANTHRPEILRLLLEHDNTPAEVRNFIAGALSLPAVQPRETAQAKQTKKESLTQRIQKQSVSARIQLALKGGREIRGILARDPNKEVVLSVLENGKISESEVEMMARSRQSFEDALRKIAKNKEWMKKYAVVFALVNNPKTPPGISVPHVIDLKVKDLAMLEKNKNVAEAVRSTAKRLLLVRKPR